MKPYTEELPRQEFRRLRSLRFESTCASCQEPVLVSRPAWWHPRERLVLHPECFGTIHDLVGVKVRRSPVVFSSGLPSLGRRR